MPIIEVSHLTKEYQLGHITSLKENVLNTFRRLGGKPIQQREDFKALDDVNFTIEEGEVVGIIGHNGAGKSTLLKHLANISKPTKGKVIVRGSIAPLIEVGAGVNPEMTGRENIFLNGAILGIPKKIIQQKLDEIIEFSELEQFIDTPVKRYSSGMTVKLGFSIATSLDADILIIDEVLAVGDLAFQRKCFDKMEHMIKRQNKTVIFVSHQVRIIERLCNRVLLLDKGKIVLDGNPTEAINLFINQMNKKALNASSKSNFNVMHTDDLTVTDIDILDSAGNVTKSITYNTPLIARLKITVHRPLKNIAFMVGVHTTDFIYLSANSTVDTPVDIDEGQHVLILTLPDPTFLPGIYGIRAWIGTPENKISFYGEDLYQFSIESDDFFITRQQGMGFINFKSIWTLNSEAGILL
jgi:lipopolysaccharide transport system ATP-binding protein